VMCIVLCIFASLMQCCCLDGAGKTPHHNSHTQTSRQKGAPGTATALALLQQQAQMEARRVLTACGQGLTVHDHCKTAVSTLQTICGSKSMLTQAVIVVPPTIKRHARLCCGPQCRELQRVDVKPYQAQAVHHMCMSPAMQQATASSPHALLLLHAVTTPGHNQPTRSSTLYG
jgi:hypothetical protein